MVFDHRKFFLANQGGYKPSLGCGWMDMTFFIPRADGKWTRHSDLLVQIHWSHAEVLRTLRRAGFNSIRLFDFHDLNAPQDPVRGSAVFAQCIWQERANSNAGCEFGDPTNGNVKMRFGDRLEPI